MFKYHLFIILIFLLLGCSTTIRVIDTESPSDLEKLPKGKTKVYITTQNRPKITAIKLQVNPDSAAWYNPSLRQYQTIATPEIQKITHEQKKHTTTAGLICGMIAGTMIGGIIGKAQADPEPGFLPDYSPAGKALAGFMIGAVVGGIVGEALGDKIIYQFQKTPQDTSNIGFKQ
ncbi:MAG: hypothetical protein CV087_20175 [Candidatus Brocadia sp. WS118]|nr:MAG: hypothetical protein CV087_20175 [Candidatus Brocadia sp. WS118]